MYFQCSGVYAITISTKKLLVELLYIVLKKYSFSFDMIYIYNFIYTCITVTEDTHASCLALWEAVLSFLTTLIQVQCTQAVEVLALVLQKQWIPIAGIYLKCYL